MINDVEVNGLTWSIVAHDIIANNDKEVAMIAAANVVLLFHIWFIQMPEQEHRVETNIRAFITIVHQSIHTYLS